MPQDGLPVRAWKGKCMGMVARRETGMKKKEMAELFDELGECALETEVAPIGEQSDRDSKKLVEIALLASASTFAFCSGIAEGSVSMPLGGKQERYHALARILQAVADMELKDAK